MWKLSFLLLVTLPWIAMSGEQSRDADTPLPMAIVGEWKAAPIKVKGETVEANETYSISATEIVIRTPAGKRTMAFTLGGVDAEQNIVSVCVGQPSDGSDKRYNFKISVGGKHMSMKRENLTGNGPNEYYAMDKTANNAAEATVMKEKWDADYPRRRASVIQEIGTLKKSLLNLEALSPQQRDLFPEGNAPTLRSIELLKKEYGIKDNELKD